MGTSSGGGSVPPIEVTTARLPDAMAVAADLPLIELARGGDEAAFEALLLPMVSPALRLAFALLRDRQAAEDAVQEACVKAWRRLNQFRYGSSLKPWFLSIVANQCKSMLRNRWWGVLKRDELIGQGTQDGAELAAGRMDLRAALQQLSVENRLVVYLFFVEGMPQEEIARTLGVRVGTVKSRVHRSLAKLRGCLEDGEREPEGAGDGG
jgi:RNA polymerase sigma factor (sigma-70 family)